MDAPSQPDHNGADPTPDTLRSKYCGLKALVVDDDRTNRMILKLMLERMGFDVLTANNGQEALSLFASEQVDMILMDILMPLMNGYQAAVQIKKQSGNRFVPIIFLTAITNEQALARCIECGGDDFLTKPYNNIILAAKIAAIMRVRELYEKLKAHKNEIEYHHERLRREHGVAEKIFSRILRSCDLDLPNIKYLLQPQSITNGDILLCARMPSGGLHIMLGDFTGHGLAAAIGAMPVSDVFYGMTEKGYSIGDIAHEINYKLKEMLPTGHFCAACLVEIDADFQRLALWNGGIPDVLIRGEDQCIKHRITSHHLPLGVLDEGKLDRTVTFVDVSHGDHIYVYSDGVIEARNPDDEMYGQRRLEELITRLDPADIFDSIRDTLKTFSAGTEQYDDITLIEIECTPITSDRRHVSLDKLPLSPTAWDISFTLDAETLRNIDPLPVLVQSLMEIQGLYEHRERLYMVLSELFSNALEHGLLALDSDIKSSPHGFMEYYAMREKALLELAEGTIAIQFKHEPDPSGGFLIISVQDSGPGFDSGCVSAGLDQNNGYKGRGIQLVQSICADLTYHGNGNHAVAAYRWNYIENHTTSVTPQAAIGTG